MPAALADDLRARGKVDLREAFIDGTHAGAKSGALRLESLAVAKQPRSCQWQTAKALLSSSGLGAVRAMKPTSSKRCSRSVREGTARKAHRRPRIR